MKLVDCAIPCDAQGCPDLQQLVRLRGGYTHIAPADWREFDRLTAAWHARRRDIAAPRSRAAAPPASLEVCVSCNQQARFGYRNAATGELYWYSRTIAWRSGGPTRGGEGGIVMNPPIDEATVRRFIELINEHAKGVINGADPPGFLQLCRINPLDEKTVVPSRFEIGDVERMIQTATDDAVAGHNVYIEARTVRPGLRGSKRGLLEDTAWVFGLVADCDADKDKGGNITVRPSLAVETSPGNYHLWYLFTRAIPATQAKAIGDAIRANSGTDHDTGVVTQCYRVPGTPNFPSPAKRARGRLTVEPTRIFQHTGRLWDPDELLHAFSAPTLLPQPQAQPSAQPQSADELEATLPAELLEMIRDGFAPGTKIRSDKFFEVVKELWLRNWTLEAVTTLLEKYPNGIAEKYLGRILGEAKRCYDKFVAGANGSAAPGAAPQPQPQPSTRPVKPTIDLRVGEQPQIATKAESALCTSGLPIFSRARFLVRPVYEIVAAADGRKTVVARLHKISSRSLQLELGHAAVFRTYKKQRPVPADAPLWLAQMLVEKGHWDIPHIRGITTTPTLRADGSLLTMSGYDPQTQFYLLPDLTLPTMPAQPARGDAEAALELLSELFTEFAFVDKELDRSVALAGLLTTTIRSALPIAPMVLVHAHASGTGKSYLVDLIATIATGRYCPVIALATSKDENAKCVGAMILSGAPSSRSTTAIATSTMARSSATSPSALGSPSGYWGAAKCRNATSPPQCSRPAIISRSGGS